MSNEEFIPPEDTWDDVFKDTPIEKLRPSLHINNFRQNLTCNCGIFDVPKITVKIVQEHDEGEQIRTHRKKRINKKWLKKYGCYGKQKLDKGQVAIVDGVVYMSRPTFRKLKIENKWRWKE